MPSVQNPPSLSFLFVHKYGKKEHVEITLSSKRLVLNKYWFLCQHFLFYLFKYASKKRYM